MGALLRVIAYLDAFNFYYGLTKNSPYKWCDIPKLCSKLVPEHDVGLVKMFTGRSRAIDDPRQPERQSAYLRALEYYGVKVYRSPFEIKVKKFRTNCFNIPINVKVPQEKGSDVKLATHLITDAYLDAYDIAIVLSNDSDLEEAIIKTIETFNKKVLVFGPVKPPNKRVSNKLRNACGKNNHSIIPYELLAEC